MHKTIKMFKTFKQFFKALYKHPPQGINELWERVEREWEEIDASVVQKLIEGLPKRILEVYRVNEGYTTH